MNTALWYPQVAKCILIVCDGNGDGDDYNNNNDNGNINNHDKNDKNNKQKRYVDIYTHIDYFFIFYLVVNKLSL